MKSKFIAAVAISVSALGLSGAAVGASPSESRPDVACMQAGMDVLRDAGLFSAVAKDGLPIETAVAVGVTVREGADISAVPNPIPLKVVLADHRAGGDSLFVYPWCE